MLADVYLAHNGSVYKEEIARSLGLEDLAEAYTDSHLVLKKIAKDLQGSPPDELADRLASSLSGILPYVKSALEILVMITAPGLEPFLAAFGYVADPRDRERWEYYKPIVVGGEGFTAYISSTIWDLAQEAGVTFRDYRVIQGEIAVLKPGVAAFHPLSG